MPVTALAAISLLRNSSTSASNGEEGSPLGTPLTPFGAFWPWPPLGRALGGPLPCGPLAVEGETMLVAIAKICFSSTITSD
jgi:hypothetical protein